MQKIGIVIPCYNESKRFDREQFVEFLKNNPSIDFCLVNDGSTDGTGNMLSALALEHRGRIVFKNLDINMGKADAIRQGIIHGFNNKTYDYLGFIDADFSAPLNQIDYLITFCQGRLSHAMIAGSRVQRMGASIIRSSMRHYMGRVFATFAGWILGLHMYDSQCGLKLIRMDVMDDLFGERFLTQWLFDLELVLRLRKRFGEEGVTSEILEVPLTVWHEKGASKLKFKFFLSVPLDLLRIRMRYKNDSQRIRK